MLFSLLSCFDRCVCVRITRACCRNHPFFQRRVACFVCFEHSMESHRTTFKTHRQMKDIYAPVWTNISNICPSDSMRLYTSLDSTSCHCPSKIVTKIYSAIDNRHQPYIKSKEPKLHTLTHRPRNTKCAFFSSSHDSHIASFRDS